MAERERVKKAIEAPVDEAAKLLAESSGADMETRLAMRIDGWGRGLAAGLEELAVSLSELRRSAAPDDPRAPVSTSSAPSAETDLEAEGGRGAERAERERRSEEELRADAARSREATTALREESGRTGPAPGREHT